MVVDLMREYTVRMVLSEPVSFYHWSSKILGSRNCAGSYRIVTKIVLQFWKLAHVTAREPVHVGKFFFNVQLVTDGGDNWFMCFSSNLHVKISTSAISEDTTHHFLSGRRTPDPPSWLRLPSRPLASASPSRSRLLPRHCSHSIRGWREVNHHVFIGRL